jgi:serine/threonine protein kinase
MGSLTRVSEYDARLADRVRTRGALPPDDAALVLLPVAEALAALHGGGRVHGAISPTAIQVDALGHATLLDPGAVAADPAFQPPDPIWGLRPHPAGDDVWSFVAVLLHVTTGRPPSIDDAAPRRVGWLAPLVELALQTDPRDRPTMAEVADYLRARVAPAPRPRRISGAAMLVAGGAVILGLAAIGAALLFGGDDDRSPRPATSTSPSTDDEPVADEPTATASAEPVAATELEAFARSYVATASSNPDRGFDLLTPSYQQSSPRYREVWSAIEDPEIVEVEGDPDSLSVSYTYTYRLHGSRRTEDVTLRLVQQDEGLLIAGASGRLR